MQSPFKQVFFGLVLCIAVAGCGGSDEGGAVEEAGAANGGLTAVQTENGIGPITTVSLAEVDASLAETGEQIFTTKCSACHKFDTRYVGPPLGDVLSKRTPAYVMNMMLNPQEMVEKHPEARKLLAEYMTPMPSQNLTEDDARALLEYIRVQQESGQ